jgi:calmodulin
MSKASSASVKMSQKEIQDYQEAFNFFDSDHDGFINTSDIGKVMRCIGLYPSEAEISQIVKNTNRSKVDFNEFLNLATRNMIDNKVNEQQMREAFRMFDNYGNGLINLMQVRKSLQNLGEKLRDEELDELIREADIDTEGNVNYEELVKILCRN